jgi:FkbM family methyltransferase
MSSRPKYREFALGLLRPFIHDGEVSIRYRCYERFYRTFLRTSDLSADLLSTSELCFRDIYHLDHDRNFAPDLVIDGGGNIGLFTLRAAASLPSNSKKTTKLILCEPLPRNIKQIQRHLDINGIEAEIQPYCLGGTRRTIPFYCRAANESSFDGHDPYDHVMDIGVVLLQDAIGSNPAERILIKLDIEGMEIEALTSFVPTEHRAIYVVGELHHHPINAPILERLFRNNGWTFEFYDVDMETSSFRACSPRAVPMLGWAGHAAGMASGSA